MSCFKDADGVKRTSVSKFAAIATRARLCHHVVLQTVNEQRCASFLFGLACSNRIERVRTSGPHLPALQLTARLVRFRLVDASLICYSFVLLKRLIGFRSWRR